MHEARLSARHSRVYEKPAPANGDRCDKRARREENLANLALFAQNCGEKIISNAEYKIVVFSANDVDKLGLSACLRKGLDEIVAYFKYKFDVNLEANLKYSAQSGLKMKFNVSKREKIDKFDENKLEQIGKFDENIVDKFDEKFDTKQTKSDSKICGRFDENLKYSAQSKLKTQFDTNSNIKKENSNAKNAKFDRNL